MPLSRLAVIPGTRLLSSTFGFISRTFRDPYNSARVWTVVNELIPGDSNKLYVRLRVMDQLGFVSFISQMDYELLTYGAKPGNLCSWTGQEYPEVGDHRNGWVGLGAEHIDLEDDMHIRELELRQQYGWENILQPMNITRFIHTDEKKDEAILDTLLWDADPDTGLGPDMRLETIRRRWVEVQREATVWQ